MCEDDAVLCPICGAELTAAPEEAANGEPQEAKTNDDGVIKNPVLAASADSPVTAEIFKDILSENKIAYSVDEKGDFLHTGFGGGFFAIDVYVDEENLETAKEIYKNLTENEFPFDDFEDADETESE